jgi:hypothetical protein
MLLLLQLVNWMRQDTMLCLFCVQRALWLGSLEGIDNLQLTDSGDTGFLSRSTPNAHDWSHRERG